MHFHARPTGYRIHPISWYPLCPYSSTNFHASNDDQSIFTLPMIAIPSNLGCTSTQRSVLPRILQGMWGDFSHLIDPPPKCLPRSADLIKEQKALLSTYKRILNQFIFPKRIYDFVFETDLSMEAQVRITNNHKSKGIPKWH